MYKKVKPYCQQVNKIYRFAHCNYTHKNAPITINKFIFIRFLLMNYSITKVR